jgi:two-component system, LuxR family, sensor kinase FixL
LSISASIVEAHGGRIWLQTGKAGATEFRFSLPLETG